MINTTLKNQILEFKSSLMGLAICFVMWFHTYYEIKNPFLSYIKGLSDIGVDLFMLLSGFSIAYSFSRNSNMKSYYKKRLMRILPKYFIVFIIVYTYYYIIRNHGNWIDVVYNLFFLNFFIDNSAYIWFIPAILLLYTILPFYYICTTKLPILYYLPYLIIILLCICVILNIKIHNHLLLFRLPIFLIGINTCKYISSKTISNYPNILYNIIGIISFILCYYCMKINSELYNLKYILYIPIVAMIVINYQRIFFIDKILVFLGGITLELYLVHERIQIILVDFIKEKFLLCIISISISIFISYIFSKLYNKIYAKLFNHTTGCR